MDKLNIISVSQSRLVMPEEAASYDNGTVTNGHGQASGVYVTVQKGTSAHINVDFTVNTISESTFKNWKSDVAKYFSKEQNEELEKSYGVFGLAGRYFSGCFGVLFGSGDKKYYESKSGEFHTESDEKKEGFAKSVYNLAATEFHVTGNLTAKGTSFFPVTVSAYVQVTKIQFSDGKELHVISSNDSHVAQKDGSTHGVKASGKLNLMSL